MYFGQLTGQLYCPPSEVSRSCCRRIKKGSERPNSPRYYYSFVERDEEEMELEVEEPHVVVQMDTESSVLYQKTCLDYYYEKPLQVSRYSLLRIILTVIQKYYELS